MAAAVVTDDFDLPALHRHLVDRLPEYARPLFLRRVDHFDLTATFKTKKQDLVRESYDPASGDLIYFNDPAQRAFVPIDAELYARIQSGQIRV
jgi:fatty-acyl-CoA synthase